ncbi:Heavy metal-associated isoprenylated plant protein 19 [Forsythia ovata]|uniref:Heavy metal-associated isoprenylated plant protein 19 n=1 Tax=Forsythia ovata TaxID=205694 RepID=A0ABD1WVH8_9LAMI
MADKKKKIKVDKVVVAEFKISMHCNACERSVAKAISRIKGVEKFVTDMKNHKVVVTGKINPMKVVKKVKKKTGKKMEFVDIDKEDKKRMEMAPQLPTKKDKQPRPLIDSQGGKNIIKFEGDHNSPSPQFYFDFLSIFFNNVLQPPEYELRSTLSDLSLEYFGELSSPLAMAHYPMVLRSRIGKDSISRSTPWAPFLE